jgi:L-ascorbate metabolism protein UlaG (beta-lactamase superfamily)
MQVIQLDLTQKQPTCRGTPSNSSPQTLPSAKAPKDHAIASRSGETNGKLLFIDTATTIIQWAGLTLMTDPNFLARRRPRTPWPWSNRNSDYEPFVDLRQLPHIDAVLLSHCHADHFDQHVEASLRRDLPITSTLHAKQHLAGKSPAEESFTAVTARDFWESIMLSVKDTASITIQHKP